jgi:DNA repair protein RecO (recombination protein O)
MQIHGDAIVLSAKKHGENNLIVTLLAAGHGRVRGLVRRPSGSQQGLFQAGNTIAFTWQARLAEHLGHIRAELKTPIAARFMSRPERLLALQTACEWSALALPEQQAHDDLYTASLELWERLGDDYWALSTVAWEIRFLQCLGFGLDLRHCALTGANDNLAYVSPRTGRAVSAEAAAEWADRLLPLPQFLSEGDAPLPVNDNQILPQAMAGFRLSGHFLYQHILKNQHKDWPTARQLLLRRLQLLQTAA